MQAKFYDFCVRAGFCKYDMACGAENRNSHSSGLDVLPVNIESTLLMRGLKPFCEFQHEHKPQLSNVE